MMNQQHDQQCDKPTSLGMQQTNYTNNMMNQQQDQQCNKPIVIGLTTQQVNNKISNMTNHHH
jgi:hypothetical protein